ncbi:hypothetical protein T06_3386 [Trichinella sp. T6]|nr:hypothetical protein T06_3386 [Trichinella sp. T6]
MPLKEYADFASSHFPILELATLCVIGCLLMACTTFERVQQQFVCFKKVCYIRNSGSALVIPAQGT